MKVVDSDKLRTWISQNEFENTTPPPVCPTGTHWDGTKCVPDNPTPPNPDHPIPTEGIVIPWNSIYNASVGVGSVNTYLFPNSDKTSITITVYPIDLSADVLCEWWTPMGEYTSQRITYGMSAKYRPANVTIGNYWLRLTGYGASRLQIRAL